MWGLVGKNLVKREWLLIGGVRMWGFEPFDDERAIKTNRAPAHVCTRTYSYLLTSTKKNQGKRNTKTTPHPLPVLLLLETDRDIREKKWRKKIGGTL